MKEVTWQELFRDADPSIQVAIDEAIEIYAATHVVKFENQAMDSSSLGASTFMVVGPHCTYKTPDDCKGRWLYDLPSQRQYAVAYTAVLLPHLRWQPGGEDD